MRHEYDTQTRAGGALGDALPRPQERSAQIAAAGELIVQAIRAGRPVTSFTVHDYAAVVTCPNAFSAIRWSDLVEGINATDPAPEGIGSIGGYPLIVRVAAQEVAL